MNNGRKARNNNLLQASDGNFGANFSYRCDNNQPIERCLESDYFDTVKTRIGPGDTIRVIEYKLQEDKTHRVSATVLLLVVARGPAPKMVLDIRPCEGAEICRYEEQKPVEEPQEKMEPDLKFIGGTGAVERDEISKLYKVKCDGEVVYETDKKGLALAIARGDTAIPTE